MKKNSKEIYLNDKQIEFITASQPTKVFLAGRGAGKSASMGPKNYMRVKYLPRGKGFFASTTYNQILTKTLPAVEQMWHRLGLKEWISAEDPGHYIVGRRPPKTWPKPYAPPRRYQNVITFFNGTTIEFLSLDRPDLVRGGSYDFGDIDEAGLVSKERFTRALLPTLRDNKHRFSHWLHHQVCFYTSIPWKGVGQWILEYEEKARQFPNEYKWVEASALDNIDILGQEGLDRLKRELPYLEYQVEVLNKRIIKLPDGFYHEFDDELHAYIPQYEYSLGRRGIETAGYTKEYKDRESIAVSLDFGGHFSCMTCWQPDGLIERCFDQFFIKDDRAIKLIDMFCETYKGHKEKLILLHGDPRGHDKNPHGDTIYNQIIEKFRSRGWDVILCVDKTPPAGHLERHHFMNEILTEQNPNLPKIRINEDRCKETILSIQLTPITKDFKKDKSKEKKPREFPQEHAPHLTDTVDYYFMYKYYEQYAALRSSGDNFFGVLG